MLRTTLTFCTVLCFCVVSYAEDAKPAGAAHEPVAATAEKSPPPQEGWFQTPKQSVLKKNVAKTLGEISDPSQLTPAVHVNSSGIDRKYSTTRTNNGTVDRLRSVRDSVFLPLETKQPMESNNVKKAPVAGGIVIGSSRRQKLNLQGTEPALKVTPKTDSPAAAKAKSDDLPRKILPSVITRRGDAEPTTATKIPEIAPTKVTEKPVDPITVDTGKTAAPTSATPTLTAKEPQLAELQPATPALTNPTTAAPVFTKPIGSLQSPILPTPSETRPFTIDAPRVAELNRELPTTSTPKLLDVGVPFTEINIVPSAQPVKPQPASEPKVVAGRTADSFAPAFTNRSPDKPMVRSNFAAQQATKPTPPKQPEQDEAVLLSNRSPVLVVKTHGQSTIRVGRVATYYITAANAGDLDAEDVVVSVNVPNWAELTRNQASTGSVRIEPSSSGDNVMRWSIRDLKQQSKQRLRIDLIPRKSRPIELGVTWNFKSVSAMAQIQVQEAKLEVGIVGPSDIQYGETKLYTITISNPGSGDAENVTLTLLPIKDGSGTTGVKELGNIKAGTRRTIEVELTARQAGELAVRASAAGDGGLKANGKQDVRVRRANLFIEAVGPTKKIAGTPARYAIKITNNGDATAQDVVAIAALPMASEYVKSSNAGAYDSERGRVRWSLGPLRPGSYQVVEVTTVLNGAGPNQLDVRTAGADKLVASASAETIVETLPDLKMSVDDPAGVVALGTEMAYEVRIVNRGSAAAHNVNLVGYFSEGIEPVTVRGWRANIEVGQVILDTIPQIAPGQEIVVKVIAKASRAGDHVFRAELHAKNPRTQLAQEEWTVFQSEADGPDLLAPSIQQTDKRSDSDELETQFR